MTTKDVALFVVFLILYAALSWWSLVASKRARSRLWVDAERIQRQEDLFLRVSGFLRIIAASHSGMLSIEAEEHLDSIGAELEKLKER